MATNFQPPPTWAEVVLMDKDPTTGKERPIFNPVWLKWFVDLTANLGAGGGGSVTSIAAGAGLTGGTITSTGTVAVNYAQVIPYTGAQASVALGSYNLSAHIIQATSAAGYKSSDGSTGATTTITTAGLVGKTITVKDGLITSFA